MANNTFFTTGLTYSRNTKSPLEDKFVFETLDNANAYINDIDQTAYVGKILSVTDDLDNTNNGLYYIDSIGREGGIPGSMHKVGRNAEVAIVSGDKTLYITESNELGSTTAIVRDSSTGKLSLVGVDGELISEVTIPISEKVIKGEVVSTNADGSLGKFIKLDIQTSETDSSTYRSLYIDVAYFDSRVDVTYDELVALSDDAKLVPGSLYRITDYQTYANLDGYMSGDHPFDIVVRALTTTELEKDAKAVQRDGDTYFDGTDIESWKLKYDLRPGSKYDWSSKETFFRTENTDVSTGFVKILNNGVQYFGIKNDNTLYYSTNLVDWDTDNNFGTLYDIAYGDGYLSVLCRINGNTYVKVYDLTLGDLYEDSNVYNHAISYFVGIEPETESMKLVHSEYGLVVIHISTEDNSFRNHLYTFIGIDDFPTSIGYTFEEIYNNSNITFSGFSVVGDKIIGLNNDDTQYYLSLTDPVGSWSATTFTYSTGWRSVAYNGSVYVAVSDYNKLNTSTDFNNWDDSVELESSINNAKIIYANGKFIIYGSYDTGYESNDGITWNAVKFPTTGYTYAEYFNDAFYFLGSSVYTELKYHTNTCKGVIYEMVDQNNNRAGYDFKNIIIRKDNKWYYTFNGGDGVVSDLSNTHMVVGNKIGDLFVPTENGNVYGVPNVIFTDATSCYLNEFGELSNNITLSGSTLSSNKIGVGCSSIELYAGSFGNIIGDGCSDINGKFVVCNFSSSTGNIHIDSSIGISTSTFSFVYGVTIHNNTGSTVYYYNIIFGETVGNIDLTNHPNLSNISDVTYIVRNGEDVDDVCPIMTYRYENGLRVGYSTNDGGVTWEPIEVDITELCIETTRLELIEKRDNAELVQGQLYRITDYQTKVNRDAIMENGEVFDIIVEASSKSALNEDALICKHDGDTYFTDSKLEEYNIKYCIDNDTNRFDWVADNNYKTNIMDLPIIDPKKVIWTGWEYACVSGNDDTLWLSDDGKTWVSNMALFNGLVIEELFLCGDIIGAVCVSDSDCILTSKLTGKISGSNVKIIHSAPGGYLEPSEHPFKSTVINNKSVVIYQIKETGSIIPGMTYVEYTYAELGIEQTKEFTVLDPSAPFSNICPIKSTDGSKIYGVTNFGGYSLTHGDDEDGWVIGGSLLTRTGGWNSVASSPTKYVAVAQGSNIINVSDTLDNTYDSSTGTYVSSWHEVTLPNLTVAGLSKPQVIYGDRFIIYSEGSYKIYESFDGETWEIRRLRCVSGYKNCQYVASSGEYVFTGSDGSALSLRYVTSSCNGVIYEMVDGNGNKAPYDFKNIMFEYNGNFYYTFSKTTNQGVIISIEDATQIDNTIKRNIIEPEWCALGIYTIPNNIWINANGAYSNYIGECSYNNIFTGTNSWGNRIGKQSYNNVFGSSFYSNIIGDKCQGNTFGSGNYNNVIQTNFMNNTISNGWYSNEIGDYAKNNTFGSGYGNVIDCSLNTVVFGSSCKNNRIGDNFKTSTIGKGFAGNNIEHDCYNFNFGDNCTYNNFGSQTHDITVTKQAQYNIFAGVNDTISFGNNCYRNIIGRASKSITFGNSCNNNSFGVQCSNNIVLDINCANNKFGDSFQNSTLVDGCMNNTFGNSCQKINGKFVGCNFGNSVNTITANPDKKFGLRYCNILFGCNSLTFPSVSYNIKNLHISGVFFGIDFTNHPALENSDQTIYITNNGERFTDGIVYNPVVTYKLVDSEFIGHKTSDNGVTWTETTIGGSGSGEMLVDILYSDLVQMRDSSGLIPGQKYKIVDYSTKSTQNNTTSAGHDFDVVVTALSTNELSENAKCVRKAGDTYFTNAKLEAWEIKYCVDNDTSRFAWANNVNGKGVIYYMKDEWGNECPYDFKNIQFKKSNVFLYTFGGTTDNSLTGGCHHNTMMDYILSSVLRLNFNTFGNNCYSNTFGVNCYSITFGNNCYSNTFGYDCQNNTFGNSCESNTFGNSCYSNTFGYGCYSNIFGYGCYSNIFGYGCNSNEFGNNCHSNTFGNQCRSNTFGNSYYENTFSDSCSSNTFGDSCESNTFGNSCSSNNFGYGCGYNTFGNSCSSNTFGDSCESNTFGNSCSSNTFGYGCNNNTFGNRCGYNTFGGSCNRNNFYTDTFGTTKKDYIRYIVLEDGCAYNDFHSEVTTSNNNYLQRIRIKGLDHTTTPIYTQITLSEVNTKYEWVICYTSDGELKQYCPDNNYNYKIENTDVLTWSASTAYVDYDYQARINIQNLTENDIVSVTFAGVDAISGNYYPTIQIYEGYILVFSKVDATITIPTIEITKIDL